MNLLSPQARHRQPSFFASCQDWCREHFSSHTAIVALVIAVGSLGVLGSLFALGNRTSLPLVYQGRLTDASFIPITDSSRDVRFKIWTALTGGSCVWSTGTSAVAATNCAAGDSATTSIPVAISGGLFTVPLGAGNEATTHNPEILINFNSGTFYLETIVDNESTGFEALDPRKQLGGSLYSYASDLLDGLESTAFAILGGQSGGQTLAGDTAASGNLILQSTVNATKGKIFFGANSVYDQSADSLGIGTATPLALAGFIDVLGLGSIRLTNTTDTNHNINFKNNVTGHTWNIYQLNSVDSLNPGGFLIENCMPGCNRRLTVSEAGNLAVGLNTPNARLAVTGVAAVTGAGTVTSVGTAVTGSGTAFDTELHVDDAITASGQIRYVTAIGSATSLTISHAFSSDLVASTAFTYTQPVAKFANSGNATQVVVNSADVQKLRVVGGNVMVDNGFGFVVRSNTGVPETVLSESASNIISIASPTQGGAIQYSVRGGGASDYHEWTTASGTQRMRLTNAGLLGIGTTAPDSLLHVAKTNTDGDVMLHLQNTGGGISTASLKIGEGTPEIQHAVLASLGVDNSSRLYAIGPTTTGILAFHTGLTSYTPGSTANERMRIDSDGKIGIGVTPSALFQVQGTVASQAHIRFGDAAAVSGTPSAKMTFQGAGINHAGMMWTPVTGGIGKIQFTTGSGNPDPAGQTVRMTIQNDGNIGIANTSPIEKLDVTGGARIGQAVTTLTTVTDAPLTSGATTVNVVSTVGYPSTGTLLIENEAMTYTATSGNTSFIGVTRGALGTTAASHVATTPVNNYLFTAIATSTTPKFVITGDGKVGVGTLVPSGPLDILGDSTAGGFYFRRHSDDVVASTIQLIKARGTTAVPVIVQSGDDTGQIAFRGYDGGTVSGLATARIISKVDGVPSLNNMPGNLTFNTATNGTAFTTEKMRITNQGDVGVGVSTSLSRFTIRQQADVSNIGGTTTASASTTITGVGTTFRVSLGVGDRISLSSAPSTYATVLTIPSDTSLTVDVVLGNGSSQTINRKKSMFRIDDSANIPKIVVNDQGFIGVGTTAPATGLHITSGNVILEHDAASSFSRNITFRKARAGAIVQSGDELGNLTWSGFDGVAYLGAVSAIESFVDGTPGTNDMPTRLSFWTTPDGSAAASERMRISNAGNVGVGTTAPTITGTGKLHVTGNTVRPFDTSRTPASSSETCNTGEITFDTSFIYVCTAANTWKQATLNAF